MATAKKKLSISPLGDRIVVQPLSRDEVSASASSSPTRLAEKSPERGTVVAIGPGKHEDGSKVPMSVKVGDSVLFSKYGYDEVKIDGVEYLILSESGVLAILES